jgi:hypothetical protein
MDIHKRWAIQRMALRAALEAAIENELRQANPQTDEMINGLLAGENVEPFQFSKEVQEMAEGLRHLEYLDRLLFKIIPPGRFTIDE